ncbi:MAG: hypothetical protein AAF039_06085 [Bacteroidota bacterium]
MKRTVILTVVAVFFCSALVSAKDLDFANPKTSISEQLREILSQNSINIENKDVLARVLFKLDQEGKIEVLGVASERRDVEWSISRKLKGKKLEVDQTSYGEVFVVTVRVTS